MGIQPTYSALTTLLKMSSLHTYPQSFIHAFIRESDARTRDRNKTQAQLVDQFKNLAALLPGHSDRDNAPSRQAVDRHNPPWPSSRGARSLPWEKWTENLPPEFTLPPTATKKKSTRKQVGNNQAPGEPQRTPRRDIG